MADLTAEQFESLPDFVKGDYEQSGDVYRPVSEGKLKSLKGKMDELDTKYKTTDSQLQEILAKHEEDRTKAEQAALERLKKEGKIDEILADHERRANETKAQYEERIKKLSDSIKSKERELVLGEITDALSVLDTFKGKFKKLIADRIDVDPETGKVTFLDENGGATSLDKAGFIAELEKDTAYDSVRKADVNRGGRANGNNGNNGGGAADLSKLSPVERLTRARAGNTK